MEKKEPRPLGTVEQGIPSYNKEPSNCGETPMKNRFSAQHDVSQDEAMRMVRGAGTSAQMNKMKGE